MMWELHVRRYKGGGDAGFDLLVLVLRDGDAGLTYECLISFMSLDTSSGALPADCDGTVALPLVGGISPVSIDIVVVLPAPL